MYVVKDSVEKFSKQFMLSRDDIKQLTNGTTKTGNLVITYNVSSYLTLPTVLSHIIEEYCVDNIEYTLRYPLIQMINVRKIILSINSNEYKFNHDIDCGVYDLESNLPNIYVDYGLKILCPRMYTKSLVQTKTSYIGCTLLINSKSYNDNIKSSLPLQNSDFNFGSLFDHIINTTESLSEQLISEFKFVNTETKSTIHSESNSINVTRPDGAVIKIDIIDQDKLNVCINIHKELFDLLRDIQSQNCLTLKRH